MDRRLLLALALSAIVILTFNIFLSPPKPPPAPADTSAAMGRAPEILAPDGVPETSGEQVGQLVGLDQAAEEEAIEVTMADYKARLTNRGGRILSWQLTQYASHTGFVELLRDDEGELGLLLETQSGTTSLDDVLFRAERSTLSDGGQQVRFTAGVEGGLQVVKTFALPAQGYMARLTVEITGAGDASAYRLVWANGIPPSEASLKVYQMAVSTIALVGTNRDVLHASAFRKEPTRRIEGNVQWAGVRNKYFGALFIPPENAVTSLVATGNTQALVTGVQVPFPLLRGAGRHDIDLYLGPLDYDVLKSHGHHLEQAVDLGWKIFRPISQFLLLVMGWMFRYLPNYGVVIILLSAGTKLLFYPLTKSSVRSMRAMQRLQPQIQALKDKYKSEPQRMNQAMMALYKENKVNPVGGCLPMVVQMPVFIGLYQVLANTIDMRGASFMLWMHDLSVPETLFTIGALHVHVLPIIMALGGVLQQKLTPSGDPRQKMMGYMMPAVMLFMFYSFPAGLNLYWTVNTLLTVAQQWWIHREEPAGAPAASAA